MCVWCWLSCVSMSFKNYSMMSGSIMFPSRGCLEGVTDSCSVRKKIKFKFSNLDHLGLVILVIFSNLANLANFHYLLLSFVIPHYLSLSFAIFWLSFGYPLLSFGDLSLSHCYLLAIFCYPSLPFAIFWLSFAIFWLSTTTCRHTLQI